MNSSLTYKTRKNDAVDSLLTNNKSRAISIKIDQTVEFMTLDYRNGSMFDVNKYDQQILVIFVSNEKLIVKKIDEINHIAVLFENDNCQS
jgi:hypothetical protein